MGASDLVAEHLGIEVRLGRAAGEAKERHVVDGGALALVEADPLGEPDGDDRRPEPVLQRLPHPEIGRERERRRQFRQPEPLPLHAGDTRRGSQRPHRPADRRPGHLVR